MGIKNKLISFLAIISFSISGLMLVACNFSFGHVHDWLNWETTTAPTCIKDGEEIRKCLYNSSHIERRDIPALGHDWGEWLIVEGEQVRECSRCEQTETEDSLPEYDEDSMLWFRLINEDKEYEISGCDLDIGATVNIPTYYKGKPVTAIGNSAFYYATYSWGMRNLIELKIESINFESDSQIERIGTDAFISCVLLESIEIPVKCKSIGAFAFSLLVKLESVVFKSGSQLEYIEYNAFNHCKSLVDIKIPASCKGIGSDAFIETGIWNDTAVNNIVYADNWVVGIKGQLGDVILKTNTVGICDEAFFLNAYEEYLGLTSIIIPKNVAAIGRSAFVSSNYLTHITVNESNNNFKTVDGVLYDKAMTELIRYPAKKNNKSFDIPLSVIEINMYAFERCQSLENITIHSGVTQIGANAFYNSAELNNIIIPDSVVEIARGTFYGCSNLANIVLPKNLIKIDDYAFKNCSILGSIDIPDSCTFIGIGAFENCMNLKTVKMPVSLIKLASYTFRDCSNLEKIDIPAGVVEIGSHSFRDCRNLRNVNIMSNSKMQRIETQAFENCIKLDNIIIPASVISIGYSAFENCSNLSNIAFEKESALQTIDIRVFYNCSNLFNIEIPKNVIDIGYDVFSETGIWKNAPTGIVYADKWAIGIKGTISDNPTIKADTVGIASRTFYSSTTYDSSVLKKIVIPASIRSIGSSAFSLNSNLENVSFESGSQLELIASSAFFGCSSLRSIEVPKSVVSIGLFVFDYSAIVTEAPEGVLYAGNWVIGYSGEIDGNILIKSGTVGISDYAFLRDAAIKSIIIPVSMKNIGIDSLALKSLEAIYYRGSKEQWEAINKSNAGIPNKVAIYFNYTD